MFISPAYAQGAATDGGMALLLQLAPLLLIFGVFYFLLIRPQQKKQREHREMLKQLKRNDNVLLAGGMLGKVTTVKDGVDEVEVEIAQNVRVKVLRSAISDVLKPATANENAKT